jgi:hypothetical protein
MTLGNAASARVRLIVLVVSIRSSPTRPSRLVGMVPRRRSPMARTVGLLAVWQSGRRYGGERGEAALRPGGKCAARFGGAGQPLPPTLRQTPANLRPFIGEDGFLLLR